MLTGEINVDMGVHVWGEEADQINGGSRLGIITARSVGTVHGRAFAMHRPVDVRSDGPGP